MSAELLIVSNLGCVSLYSFYSSAPSKSRVSPDFSAIPVIVSTHPKWSSISVPGIAEVLRSQTLPFIHILRCCRVHNLFVNKFVANRAVAVHVLTDITLVLQWKKQGRIHGQYQSRTGGQGRKCVFSHFPTRSPQTNRPTDQPTNGRTDKASYRVACPRLKTVQDMLTVTCIMGEF